MQSLKLTSVSIQHRCGLRQGTPIANLFIIAIKPLHRLLEAAAEADILTPLHGREVKLRVSLYADDVVIFANQDRQEINTMLDIFNQSSKA